jgi:Cu(I)/Ag(I) efflux system membrane fusion protein
MRIVLIALGGFAAAAVTYWLGAQQGLPAWFTAESTDVPESAGMPPVAAGDIDPATGRRVLYWHDPMVPGQRFDQPGRSPFMDMDLVPVYEGAGEDGGGVEINPRIQQNLGIRTVRVTRGTIAPRIEAVGNITYNERDQVVVEARAMAFVEALHVRATLDAVAAGEALADLYVPRWIAVQEEFLAVADMEGSDLAPLVDAARQRMRQAGMTEAQIRAVEASGTVNASYTVRAPIAGVVDELGVREGMTVMPGDLLYRINGIDTVWVTAEVPETQAMLVRVGAPVTARSGALPGVTFAGTVEALLPSVDPVTRTIEARIEIDNRDRSLVPGMFVSVTLAGPGSEALLVPTEAVIETGRRKVVIRAEPGGTFAPVDVETGLVADGETQILAGLNEGDSVVASGQFLIDSEANLSSTITRMGTTAEAGDAIVTHSGKGRIEAFAPGQVTLSHGPIPSLQWGSMTMGFELPPDVADADLAVGDAVDFRFVLRDDGSAEITAIDPAESDPQ